MAKYRRPASMWGPIGDINTWNAYKAGRRKGVTQAGIAIGGAAVAYKGVRAVRRRRKGRARRDRKGRFR
jgi:hypothetical protein